MKREPDDLEFAPAPVGGRVRAMTFLAVAVVFILAVVITWVATVHDSHAPLWVIAIGPLPAIAIIGAVGFGSRIRAYRLIGTELLVDRGFMKKRFSLGGLVTVETDRRALEGARKVIGNDGLGAVAGRFRSKRLGPFRVYASNGDNAVVLRWPDQCLVVTPDRAYPFVQAVRERARLNS